MRGIFTMRWFLWLQCYAARSAVWPGMNDFGRRVNLNNRIVISTQFGCVICATGWADRESELQMDGILPFKRLLNSFLGR